MYFATFVFIPLDSLWKGVRFFPRSDLFRATLKNINFKGMSRVGWVEKQKLKEENIF